MKNLSLKSKILLAAIMIGSLGAGATTLANMPDAQDPIYDWVGDGPNGSGSFTGTRAEAVEHYGCNNGIQVCAQGTPLDPVDDPETLLKN